MSEVTVEPYFWSIIDCHPVYGPMEDTQMRLDVYELTLSIIVCSHHVPHQHETIYPVSSSQARDQVSPTASLGVSAAVCVCICGNLAGPSLLHSSPLNSCFLQLRISEEEAPDISDAICREPLS